MSCLAVTMFPDLSRNFGELLVILINNQNAENKAHLVINLKYPLSDTVPDPKVD